MPPWFRRKPPPEEPPRVVRQEPDQERRRAYRQVGEIRAQMVLPGGRVHDITVLNVSPTGLCFAGADKVSSDQEVYIRFSTLGNQPVVYTATVRGRCQWCAASNRKSEPWSCGLVFPPMTLTQHLALIRFFQDHFSLSFAGPGDKRRQVRLGFSKPTQVSIRVDKTRRTIEGQVKNVSADGVGLFCSQYIEPSSTVTIDLKIGSRETISLKGVVIHARRLSEGRFHIGVFTTLTSESERARLAEILGSASAQVLPEPSPQAEAVTRPPPPTPTGPRQQGPSFPAAPPPLPPPSPAHEGFPPARPAPAHEGFPPAKPTPAHGGVPPARPAPPEVPAETAAVDDDEPFSWGGPPTSFSAPSLPMEPAAEDPLEAWARSVNLPASPPGSDVEAPPRRRLSGPGAPSSPGEGSIPYRPQVPPPGGPEESPEDTPTLRRLGPLVRTPRQEPGAAPRTSAERPTELPPPTPRRGSLGPGATPERPPAPARRSGPKEISWGPDETPPTINLGPLIPSLEAGPVPPPSGPRPSRPAEAHPSERPPSGGWMPVHEAVHGPPEEEISPPTIQLGPLVPADETDLEPPRPARGRGLPWNRGGSPPEIIPAPRPRDPNRDTGSRPAERPQSALPWGRPRPPTGDERGEAPPNREGTFPGRPRPGQFSRDDGLEPRPRGPGPSEPSRGMRTGPSDEAMERSGGAPSGRPSGFNLSPRRGPGPPPDAVDPSQESERPNPMRPGERQPRSWRPGGGDERRP